MASIRWHDSSCQTPDVSIKDETAHCRNCSSQCRFSEFDIQKAANVPPKVPPNEPRGQMNLRWPACVPYSRTKVGFLPADTPPMPFLSIRKPENSIAAAENRLMDDTVHSLIYGDTLAADEFRLLCLSADEDENAPLHVVLETYKHGNCPEYETVSYTWGGEENDYAARWPIFIGSYWDLLFQTKNCWNMLRFVRPWRAVRMVWVDALCINQANLAERGNQVAKMNQIYEQCSRAIVYVGTDLARSVRGQFPSRRRLEELEGSGRPQLPGSFGLQELFQRKYFSRVWVIQELILSQHTSIRVGNTDFWTDPSTSSRLAAQDRNWDKVMAPWVRYISQKTLPVDNIYELLRLTSNSRASDPRDRVFGVLGLLGGDNTLQPDYSLSPQHVFIGLLAHLIINLKNLKLLCRAAGLSTPASSPSWMPEYTSHESWKRIFAPPESYPDAAGFISTEVLKLPSSEEYTDKETPLLTIFHFDSSGNTTPALSFSDAYIDAHTGALSLPLIHLCALSSQPRRVGKIGSLGVFEVRNIQNPLYLTAKTCLDEIIRPGSDHVFALHHGIHDTPILYLILRELDPPTRTYKLVTHCPQVFLSKLGADLSSQSLRGKGTMSIRVIMDTVYDLVKIIRQELDHVLTLHRGGMLTKPNRPFISNDTILRGFLRGAEKEWDVFPLYRGVLNEEEGLSPDLEAAYRSCTDTRFPPRVADGFVEFSFEAQDWAPFHPYYCWTSAFSDFENPWEWRTEGNEWKPTRWLKTTLLWMEWFDVVPEDTGQQRMHVRAPITAARKLFQYRLEYNLKIVRMRRILACSLDDPEEMLRNDPTEEHRAVGFPGLYDSTFN